MRDFIIVGITVWGSLAAFRKPWIGVILWTWVSLMNPHRYAYGFAYSAPLAAMAAGATVLGLLMTKDRESPMKGAPMTWLAVFTVWITLSWCFGIDIEGHYDQWLKVMKVFFMIFIGMALLRTRKQIFWLVCISTFSLAVLGIKGGVFTVAHGGNYRVWGPPGSFIEDNNEFALALVMTIPLLRFIQLQLKTGWRRHLMTLSMLLCAAASLGSQSRGALLAISAMTVVLWWRGQSRVLGGIVMGITAIALVSFMPDTWSDRMSTIQTYEQDRSAMGRISAWWNAYGVAKNYLFGGGMEVGRPELFALYSPFPDYVHAAHSIYFQALGNHGFIGLFIFLGVFVSTYVWAGRLRKEARDIPEARWAHDLGAMAQVSLLGFAVGGAFLSLVYFDLPYYVMMMVVLARVWVRDKGWVTETAAAAAPAGRGTAQPQKNMPA
jgi:probable O-glycosylation ligase (exosortase A-associated)